MVKANMKGDVAYYKPLSVCKAGTELVGYKTQYGTWHNVHTKTKPIAYSTKATLDWLKLLYDESNSWEEMLAKADSSSGEYIRDEEAVSVIEAYIKCKCPWGDVNFR